MGIYLTNEKKPLCFLKSMRWKVLHEQFWTLLLHWNTRLTAHLSSSKPALKTLVMSSFVVLLGIAVELFEFCFYIFEFEVTILSGKQGWKMVSTRHSDNWGLILDFSTCFSSPLILSLAQAPCTAYFSYHSDWLVFLQAGLGVSPHVLQEEKCWLYKHVRLGHHCCAWWSYFCFVCSLCAFPLVRSEGQVIPRMGFQLQGEWSCSGQAVHRAARALLGDGVAEHKEDPVSLPGQILFPSFWDPVLVNLHFNAFCALLDIVGFLQWKPCLAYSLLGELNAIQEQIALPRIREDPNFCFLAFIFSVLMKSLF